jgi:RND superfamily putative drug exporter
MKSIARIAIEKRWYVLTGWVAFIVLAQLLSSGLGGATYRDTFSLPGTETDKVVQLLDTAGHADQSGLTGKVVLHARSGTLAAAPDGVSAAFAQLCTDGLHVVGVATPWQSVQCANGRAAMGPGQPSLLSADKTIAIADVSWHSNKYDQSLFDGVYNHLTALRSADLQVEFTGDAFQGQGQDDGGIPPFLLGFIAALIILAIVFRTAGATALPLASAIAALTAGLGLIGVLSHVMDVSNITPQLTELMVIGVGVDYALFIVTRHRRNLRRGVSVPDSIAAAIDTSGRAVLFAGSTVCVAMLGLMALGVSFFYGMALGTAIAVSLTMLASLTLLPALLSFLGLRVLPRKQRREVAAGRFVDAETTGIWARWAGFVSRRPVALAALGGLVMVTLAIPFFAMRLGQADQGNDPAGTTTRKGYDLIAQGFGAGYNSTLSLVVDGPNAPATARQVGQELVTVTNVDPHSVYVPARGLTPELSIVSFKSLSAPQDEATTNLVTHLRDDVLPPIYDGTGDHVYVFGQTAIQVDFTHVLAAKMPLFMAAVVGLSFLLLLIAFRSLVVPLTAAVMNLLAAGAAFGVVVAIFQWGWFAETLGIGKGGPIESWVPVMVFAIVFGLSMDYQVFLVSRMHEEWVHTRDNRRAVTTGQAATGGIITAAAVIMIAVFAGFVLDPNRAVKLFGVGLAGAVFLDAFVLRTILVPSLMHLLGRSNWFFPKVLDRITPRVSVEPPDAPALDDDAPERELVPV